MSSEPARKLAGWDDLLSVPEGYIGEIVGGTLVMHPRPAAPHLESASDLGGLLVGPFRFGHGGPGGWVIIDEPRIALGSEVRVPDLAAWKAERYGRPEQGPYRVLPDWICELLSPGTALVDRTERLPLYAEFGIPHFWLIDPIAQTVETYVLSKGSWIVGPVVGRDAKVRLPPFDAIEIELNLLWGGRPAPPEEDE